VPVSVQLAPGAAFADAFSAWKEERRAISEHGTWLRDVVGRMTALRGKPELTGARLDLPAVRIGCDAELPSEMAESSPQLIIDADGQDCRLRYRSDRHSADVVAAFCERFCDFLRNIAARPARPLNEFSTLS